MLVGSNPSSGNTLAKLPAEVSFTFDENVAVPAYVSVIAPDGMNLAVGDADVLDATVTQRIDPNGPDGEYTMSFRVVSGDSHPVIGSVSFAVAGQSSASPSVATPVPAGEGGSSAASTSPEAQPFVATWYFRLIIVGLVLLFVAGLVFARGGSEPAISGSGKATGEGGSNDSGEKTG